jgi:hypothetical protein
MFSAVAIAAGLADKAVRTPGRPEWAANSAIYRALADNAGLLSTVIGSATAYVLSEGCSSFDLRGFAVTCQMQQQGLTVLTLALVYLGILDQAFVGKSPAQARLLR